MARRAGIWPSPTYLVGFVGLMGGPGSGRKPQEVCGAGEHPLEGDNIVFIKRAGGKIERACRPCRDRRMREWWRKNKGKDKQNG